MGNKRWWLTVLGVAGLVGAAPQDVAAPGAVATPGAVAVRSGLQVRALVDKTKAVPDDLVTVTLVCRNLGPAREANVRVEQAVPAGLEMVPQPLAAGARYERDQRRVVWTVPLLNADDESSFSFQARVVATEPGTALQAAPRVQSTVLTQPRAGEAATTEVASVPLLAAFAMPDVMLAASAPGKPLIDVGAAPGQPLVERLVALGVVNGYPDGMFKPGEPVSRAQATKMIVATGQLAGLRDRINLSVALARGATIDVGLVDGKGQAVRKLASAWTLPAGTHHLVWDGKNDRGEPVPVGVYRYEVRAGDNTGVEQRLDGTVNVVTVQPLPRDLRTSFRDVPRSAWYHPYVAAAEERGIVKGYPGGVFSPSAPISRVENTVMVVRAAGLEAEAQRRMNESLALADATAVPRWAIGYVAVATAEAGGGEGGVFLVGYSENKFLPDQTLTRGEAALVLERFVDRSSPQALPASGRIARGHQVTINGTPVSANESGRFRQRVALPTAARPAAVSAR